MSRHSASAGFTMFEVVIAMSLFALAASSLSSVFGSNMTLVDDTRAHQRAESAHRKNMVALGRVLRGIDIESLGGLDGTGKAAAPTFARVLGADDTDFTYAPNEQLVWSVSPIAVDGVVNPGSVYLDQGGKRQLVADRIPAGGFWLQRDGKSLRIHLTTYYVTSTSKVSFRTSETVVSVRN